jgi:hypothetical protein
LQLRRAARSCAVPNRSLHPTIEILPPAKGRDVPDLARLLAWLLDDLFPIPGTRLRFGLDPVIGILPAVGGSSTAAVSCVILIHALRAGVPRIVLVRMALNILVNTLGGSIPGIGDVFSAFFKSNRRNVELIERHAGSRASTKADWIFVCGLVGGLLLVAVAASVTLAIIVWKAFQFLLHL